MVSASLIGGMAVVVLGSKFGLYRGGGDGASSSAGTDTSAAIARRAVRVVVAVLPARAWQHHDIWEHAPQGQPRPGYAPADAHGSSDTG